MNYWLVKTEPSEFSIDDFLKAPKKTEPWNGIRNYQARNFMRDKMKKGDLVFIYHSNCKQIGIVGLSAVAKEAYPDPLALDPKSKYYDPKSTPDNNRWVMVDLKFVEKFNQVISLATLKTIPALAGMQLLAKGNRLSVLPIKAKEFKTIMRLV